MDKSEHSKSTIRISLLHHFNHLQSKWQSNIFNSPINMTQKFLKFIFTATILTSGLLSNACTIFMANDGKNVWIGNNEDEVPTKKYRLWYYPAKKDNYGYMLWTELIDIKIIK